MDLPRGTVTLPRGTLLPTALLIAGIGLGCDPGSDLIAGTDVPEVRFERPGGCPDHPSCKPDGDPGSGASGTVDMTVDGVLAADDQPVDIAKDSKSNLNLIGGQLFESSLSYFTAAGSPAPGALGACVTDPPNLDNATLTRLIARFTDGAQERGFVVSIDRKNIGNPSRSDGLINQTWWDVDGDGRQYRTRLINSFLLRDEVVTVVEGPPDTFTFTGGAIVSWDMGTNEVLACPNVGTAVVTLVR
jgi:hypothetical protein